MFLVLEEIRNIAEGHQAERLCDDCEKFFAALEVCNLGENWAPIHLCRAEHFYYNISAFKLGQISKKLTFRNKV